MFAPSLAPQWDVWPDCESAVIRLAQLNGHGFALLKVQLWQCCGGSAAQRVMDVAVPSLSTKQGTLLHTMLKRVSGISKWCRFIQGWKIYALGVENLKWQEENFPLHLAWGLRRCIIHGKKKAPGSMNEDLAASWTKWLQTWFFSPSGGSLT